VKVVATFTERKQAFLDLGRDKPSWLSQDEWDVLDWYLGHKTPSELGRDVFLEIAKQRMASTRNIRMGPAFERAQGALDRGLAKLDKRIKGVSVPPIRSRKSAQPPPWWAGLED
jgi:hypothetical protein